MGFQAATACRRGGRGAPNTPVAIAWGSR